jgi:ribosomal protein S18 acetylase RimI-like enzyme
MNLALSQYSTRVGTVLDFDFLWDQQLQVYRAHIEVIWGWDEDVQRKHFLENLNVESGIRLIIEQDAIPIGNLEIEYRPGSMFICNLQIMPEAQGQGVGTSIIRACMDRARKTGDDISLQAFIVNHRAITFYGRLGFEVIGRSETHLKFRWLPEVGVHGKRYQREVLLP